MPWTETARREYRRDCPRYASDLTDDEWSLIEPFMPSPCRISSSMQPMSRTATARRPC